MPPNMIHNNSNNINGSGGENGNSSSENKIVRPGDNRRKVLNDELAIPIVSNFFPLERYYDAAQSVYQMTIDTYDANMIDDCYLYGKRYCLFCVDAIPTHNYYNQNKYKQLRVQHTKQVLYIISILETISIRMDNEEIEKQQLEQQRIEYEQQLEQQRLLNQYEQLSIQHTTNSQRTRIANNETSSSSSTNADVQMSALQKLALLNKNTNGTISAVETNTLTRIKKDPSGDKDDPLQLQQQQQQETGLQSLSSVQPLLPPPPYTINPTSSSSNGIEQPPPYESIANSSKTATTIQQQQRQVSKQQKLISKQPPIRQLADYYLSQYKELQKIGKIQVTTLDTYQGRFSNSINGCTVISALVAATHLQTTITDSIICNIIDSKAGPILKTIRSKLGLSNGALIIPSDVHDHMVDCNIFYQNQFVDVIGGNIVDRNHYGEFLKLLAIGNDTKNNLANVKTSATLFFREHVISIIKTPISISSSSSSTSASAGSCYYDIIDSMPLMGTGGTRTRCVDISSLEIVLQWYATRKLAPSGSQQKLADIDKHPWNDTTADFDPRVFQGFVWKCIPQ